jgi:hypothetical protein
MLLLYPCLVFNYTLGNAALMSARGLLGAPLVGFGVTLGSILLGYTAARALGLPGVSRRTFAFCTGINNYGYIPVPLSLLIFKNATTTGVVLVYGVGVEVAIWTVGVLLLAGEWHVQQLRRLLNPPVICLALAIALNLSGASNHLPGPVQVTLRMLGATAIPFGLLLIGSILCDLAKRARWLAEWRAPVAGLALRLGLLPVALLALAACLPASWLEVKRVLVLEAAMPCGIFPIVIVNYYQGDASLALRLVLTTTLAGLVAIPLWLTEGLQWLKLG